MKKLIIKKYHEHKETIENFFWRALQIFSKQGVTFLIFFLSSYFLVPYDFGILNYLMAILSLLMVFSDFGISSATSKYIAEYKAKNSQELNQITFSVSLLILVLFSFVSLFIILFGKYIFKENYILILWFLPYLLFVPLSSVFDGVYRGINDFKKLSYISLIIGIFSLITSYFLIKSYLLYGAIIVQNLLYFLLVLFLFLGLKDIKFKFNKKVIRKIINYSIIIGVINLSFFFYTKADLIVLKYFGYVVEIGYYEIINKIFTLLLIPFMILGQVIAPNMTKKYVEKRYVEIRGEFIKQNIIIFFFGILLSLILFFIFPIGIKIFFKQYFTEDTIFMFKILLLTLPLKLLSAVINHGHTIPTGNAHFSMWATIPTGIANVILDIIFISRYGFIGVIYATLICYIFANVLYMTLYYFKLNRLVQDG